MASPQIELEPNTKSHKIPTQYIQPPQLRPNNPYSSYCKSPKTETIPILDLSNPTKLKSILKEWGAFQLVNHGVPLDLLDGMKNVGRQFFEDCSEDYQEKYRCDSSKAATEGYGSKMLEKGDGVLDWRLYFDHHTLPVSRRNPNNWPDFPDNYRELVLEYSKKMEVLAQKLLIMISESLGLQPSYIEEAVGEVYQNITISYYPPCPQPDLALGLQSHSDMGAITLLVQDDVGGLEVLKNGEWILVQPMTGAIVVILADQTEIISNGEYKSSVHRALVNATKARISVATFYDPPKERKIYPAPQLVTEGCPQKYREVVYGDYVKSWYSKGPDGKRNIDALLI